MELTDIEFKYSTGPGGGGAANSYGGAITGTDVTKLGFTALSTITGVTINEVGGDTEGVSTFEFISSSTTIKWRPFGEAFGPEVYIGSNGTYVLHGGSGPENGYCVITVVSASLPGTDQTEDSTISLTANGIFTDVDNAEAAAGSTKYRCIYIKNADTVDDFAQLVTWLAETLAGPDSIEIAYSVNGVGNGSSTGVAETLNDDEDSTNVLSGYTWYNPTDAVNGIVQAGPVIPGNCIALWIKRTVPAQATEDQANDDFTLACRAYIGV